MFVTVVSKDVSLSLFRLMIANDNNLQRASKPPMSFRLSIPPDWRLERGLARCIGLADRTSPSNAVGTSEILVDGGFHSHGGSPRSRSLKNGKFDGDLEAP